MNNIFVAISDNDQAFNQEKLFSFRKEWEIRMMSVSEQHCKLQKNAQIGKSVW